MSFSWITTELGQDIFEKKYRYNNETDEEFLDRVAGDAPKVKELIREGYFLPAGRILAGRGTDVKQSYFNCFVRHSPEDNIPSIMQAASDMATIYSRGGGSGINLSTLRPRGAKVRNAADTSTGVVSFMDIFSATANTIGEKGRRGATIIMLDASHPDVIEFIGCKNDTSKINAANISVIISEDFVYAVKYDTDWAMSFTDEYGEKFERIVKARELLRLIAEQSWATGEPGIINFQNGRYNKLLENDPEYELSVNPCMTGDTLLLTRQGSIPISDVVGQVVTIWNGYEWSTVIPFKSGENQELCKVQCSNGSVLKCTPYHKFVIKDRGRIECWELEVGDTIADYTMPYKSDNYTPIKRRGIKITAVEKLDYTEDVYCVTEPKNRTAVFNGIMTANCGEMLLPTAADSDGACCLGSFNLSRYYDETQQCFDEALLKSHIPYVVEYMDNLLDENIERLPLQRYKDGVSRWRELGLGFSV